MATATDARKIVPRGSSAATAKRVVVEDDAATISRVEIRPTQKDPDFIENLRRAAKAAGVPMTDFGRDAINEAIERQKAGVAIKGSIDWSQIGTNQFRAKFLAKAPCGDWREAIETAGEFVFSQDVADSLEARPGDIVVLADGQSMEGAGIPDGALLLMRPLQNHARPARNDVALVQIQDSNGNYDSTIKRWIKSGQTPAEVVLHDGDGDLHRIPNDTIEVRAVAVARGLVTRI
jgi:hypothetical protein